MPQAELKARGTAPAGSLAIASALSLDTCGFDFLKIESSPFSLDIDREIEETMLLLLVECGECLIGQEANRIGIRTRY